MKKELLLIPGPVMLPERVKEAMSRPVMGHRTIKFSGMIRECCEIMQEVFQTSNDVIIITGSGTSAMEAALANIIDPGDKVVSCINGKFSERLGEISEVCGAEVLKVEQEWGKGIRPEQVEAVLKEDVKIVTFAHNETSTGVLNPAKEIVRVAKKHDALVIMDGITSVGGDVVKVDDWGIDLCIVGSQKCLAAPTGLAALSVSEEAWKVIEEKPRRNYYLDLRKYRKSLGAWTTPFTPAVNLFYGLHEALKIVQEEGLENRIQRHRNMAKFVYERCVRLGLDLFAEEGYRSHTVTAIKHEKADYVRARLKEKGIRIAGGQAHLTGKIFRIGHMGAVQMEHLEICMSAIEDILEGMK
jgi:aspartate aminotransferase-like enzyme